MGSSQELPSPQRALRRLLVLLEALSITSVSAEADRPTSEQSVVREMERETIAFGEASRLLTPASVQLLRDVADSLAGQPPVAQEIHAVLVAEIAALRHRPDQLEALVALQQSILAVHR